MMKKTIFCLILLTVFSCQGNKESTTADSSEKGLYKPHEDLGQLFVDIQMAGLYPDSKTFVDAAPKHAPAAILEFYEEERVKDDFDLKNFVETYFDVPGGGGTAVKTDSLKELKEHLISHWDYLTRDPDVSEGYSSLIPLPKPYIVPGGRFREIYYWDSFFTLVGLAASDRWDMVTNMTDNFAHLIDQVGFIPNGNRSYYLSRSQPPFFSLMVALIMNKKGQEKGLAYLPQLEKEYHFWMKGKEQLTGNVTAADHTVLLEDSVVLNRYWDNSDEPRPESYREDVELAEKVKNKKQLYRHLRSAAESGWDFSARWFDEEDKFETIATTNIIPVDLNSLLYHMEKVMADLYELDGQKDKAQQFDEKATVRKEAILKYCWDPEKQFFTDYHFIDEQFSDRVTLAGAFPLYFGICTPDQAIAQAGIFAEQLLKPQGLVTTNISSGQQWDSPNGWAPLQWMAIKGLEKYHLDPLANEIKSRWIKVNEKVYRNTGKMMEKYNVVDSTLLAGGGEYPTQDGFGWTNGVYLGLVLDFSPE
ncbi:MAG: alpha,alpha-trehalase TreA [Bacteroidota bacterium]